MENIIKLKSLITGEIKNFSGAIAGQNYIKNNPEYKIYRSNI